MEEGVAAQVGLPLMGLDPHLDIEALIKDAKDFKLTPGHIGKTAFDGVCVLPIIGVLKNVGKAGDAIKAEKMLGEIEVLNDVRKEINAATLAKSGGKADFIVTPKGTVMPTNKDFDLVDTLTPTNIGGDWFQIHNSHTHDGISPHTHYPEMHTQNGRVSRERIDKGTTASDIDNADSVVKDGSLRQRINKKDKGGK